MKNVCKICSKLSEVVYTSPSGRYAEIIKIISKNVKCELILLDTQKKQSRKKSFTTNGFLQTTPGILKEED